MQRLVYILTVLIYFQAILNFSLLSSESDYACNVDKGTTLIQNIETVSKSHNCCVNINNTSICNDVISDQSKISKLELAVTKDYKKTCEDGKDCKDECECPCCYKSAPVYVATYKVNKSKYKSIYRTLIYGSISIHAFDYKSESFQPPRNV